MKKQRQQSMGVGMGSVPPIGKGYGKELIRGNFRQKRMIVPVFVHSSTG